jgi:hypothetical protein
MLVQLECSVEYLGGVKAAWNYCKIMEEGERDNYLEAVRFSADDCERRGLSSTSPTLCGQGFQSLIAVAVPLLAVSLC